jgi:rRNA-processing protein FCF1
VLFDTNALLIPFQFKINPYEQVRDLVPKAELLTLKECIAELKGLKPGKWEEILSIGKNNGLKVVGSGINGLSVDDTIVEYAKKHGAMVFTQDKLLKKKVLKSNLRLVIMRQKKTLEITG